ncbi:MAG: tetratricopeptide repeat protein [Blastocatellia bacterium]
MTMISLSSPLSRLLLLAGLLLVLSAPAWFSVRTALGDRLLATTRLVNAEPATSLASADAAVQFAPRLAQFQYQRGQLYLGAAVGTMAETNLQTALTALQTAARLSPEDYRIWLAIGQAQERAGKMNEARQALQRALALAPNYYEPHWIFGNHLLRSNESDAAFAEFRQALAIRPTELPLLFDYAWNTLNGDAAAIVKALAPPIHAQAEFAGLLVRHDKVNEGMAMWRELNTNAPKLARINARTFLTALLEKQHLAMAYEVWQAAAQTKRADENELPEAVREDEARWYTVHPPDAGSLLNNGDFEEDLRTGTVAPFQIWRLTATKGLMLSRNNQQHHSGNFSLQLNFDVSGNAYFPILEQIVPVNPGQTYHLSFAVKTEDLQTLSAPLVEVYDAADLKRPHTATKPFPLGNNPWQEITLDFPVAATTEALAVRIYRPPCTEAPCPLRGRIWLDSFKLASAH